MNYLLTTILIVLTQIPLLGQLSTYSFIQSTEKTSLLDTNSISIVRQDTFFVLIDPSKKLHVKLKSEEVIYNWVTNKITTISPTNKVTIFPLYAEIDFRISERQNRLNFLELLRKTDKDNWDEIDVSSTFGILSENHPLDIRKTGNRVDYYISDKLSAQFEPSKENEITHDIGLFLLYQLKLHPKVLDQIIASEFIPERLTYYYNEVDSSVISQIRLLEHVKKEGDIIEPTSSYQSLTDSLEMIDPSPTLLSHTKRISGVNYFLDKGSPLNAVLFVLQQSFISGTPDKEALNKSIIGNENNGLLKMLLYGSEVGETKEEQLKKIAVLETLKDSTDLFHEVLDYYIARNIHDVYVRISILEDIVRRFPGLTVVLQDLSYSYRGAYKMAKAWQCFDYLKKFGRIQQSKTIIDYEQALKSEEPLFFYPN